MKPTRIVLFILALLLLLLAVVSCAPKVDKWYSNFDMLTSNFIEHDGWLYYSEFGKFGYDGLYRMCAEGTEKTKLTDQLISKFGIYENRIYVLLSNSGAFSMKLDGSDVRLIDVRLYDFGNIYAHNLAVGKDGVYLIASGAIYKINEGHVSTIQLSRDIDVCIDFSISGNWVYYIRQIFDGKWGLYLYKMRTDKSEIVKLTDQRCMAIDYDENWIYYVDESGKNVFKMRMDGSETLKLTRCNSFKTSFFKVFGDWVYYENKGEDPGLYKVNTQSGESIKVLDNRISAYTGMGGNWLININTDYREIPSKTTYQLIRVGNSVTMDGVIDQLLEDMPPDIEIRKYE